MLVEICLLSKSLGAPRVIALERPTTCMHPKVVTEVVPLTEKLRAALVFTCENLGKSFSLGVFVFVDFKFPRRWYLLVVIELGEVQVLTTFNVNF